MHFLMQLGFWHLFTDLKLLHEIGPRPQLFFQNHVVIKLGASPGETQAAYTVQAVCAASYFDYITILREVVSKCVKPLARALSTW